jgi:hypothetical protein
MRRSALALVFLVASLFAPAPSSACWKCTYKLTCRNQECWTELICGGNLVFNQRGFSECYETIGGCYTEGQICKWVALPKEKDAAPLFHCQETDHDGPLLCAIAS